MIHYIFFTLDLDKEEENEGECDDIASPSKIIILP